MHTHPVLHIPWRVLVGTVGTVVVLAGIAMMVLPGPGVASVLLGLLILSTEFRWAHRLLRPARVWARRSEKWAVKTKDEYLERRRERRAAKAARRGRASGSGPPPPDTPTE
ncbi:PGPGW domain-containing protein [Nocardiopsis valliformis]|uniref:PGPGW domain-containing protein n=1 Tax=Nocardiopsis valliformis TaxID=239974 RepID=UPI0003493F3A|nr:PGPGW domain-containing protein [Nocardiopsis valliformis]